jgi:hypothetical protein
VREGSVLKEVERVNDDNVILSMGPSWFGRGDDPSNSISSKEVLSTTRMARLTTSLGKKMFQKFQGVVKLGRTSRDENLGTRLDMHIILSERTTEELL